MSEAVSSLPPALYLPALLIAVSLLGTALMIICFFLRYWMTNQERKDAEQDKAIEKIRDDVTDFKASLPRQYVLKEDFIRAVASLDKKMDDVAKNVCEIHKNLNHLLGGKP